MTASVLCLWLRWLPFSLGDVAGVDLLRWEDQQALRRYLQEGPAALSASSAAARGPPHDAGASPSPTVGARAAGAPARGPKGKASKQVQGQEEEMAQTGPGAEAAGDFSVEYASSNRSSCRGCGEKIAKGEVRESSSSYPRLSPLQYHFPLRHYSCRGPCPCGCSSCRRKEQLSRLRS